MQPLKTRVSPRLLSTIGWAPRADRSMIDSRRWPSADGYEHGRPPMAKRHRTVRDDAVGVGATGGHGCCHPGHRADVRRPSVPADLSADTTHVVFAPSGRPIAQGRVYFAPVSIQVSLLPPPDDELTMRDPRAATRVSAAAMTCADTESSGRGRRCTNARRSTWWGYMPSPSDVGGGGREIV